MSQATHMHTVWRPFLSHPAVTPVPVAYKDSSDKSKRLD